MVNSVTFCPPPTPHLHFIILTQTPDIISSLNISTCISRWQEFFKKKKALVPLSLTTNNSDSFSPQISSQWSINTFFQLVCSSQDPNKVHSLHLVNMSLYFKKICDSFVFLFFSLLFTYWRNWIHYLRERSILQILLIVFQWWCLTCSSTYCISW